ncbi:ankyrin repeat and SOCS box protein 9-like [Oncorhynchus masou masou]|uniref:ankyrin repeat and SOCS box protein 9-like n=1 Tax=Oncorhynchus masou masou TaxID=90313 RepID=UPI003182C980
MRQATEHSSDNQRKNATQAGSVVFLSNPLMSDIESDWSPIHDAAYNGRVLTLRNLIAQGTCVNLATLERVAPLHGACLQGHSACAKLLIENGANVNVPTLEQTTPLSEACAQGHVACVTLLLQHGALPEGYSLSASPIHQAAAKDQVTQNALSLRFITGQMLINTLTNQAPHSTLPAPISI